MRSWGVFKSSGMANLSITRSMWFGIQYFVAMLFLPFRYKLLINSGWHCHEPYFGWGANLPSPLVNFFNNSARKIFIAMKLLAFLQLLIVQLLKKLH